MKYLLCKLFGHKFIRKLWSFGPYDECKRCDHTVFLKNDGTPCDWEYSDLKEVQP